MESKIELLSNEYREINNIIALAKADSDVEQILLSEIAREFKDELNGKAEQIIYDDKVFEVIELAKHDSNKKETLLTVLIENDEIEGELRQHYYDYFGSNGIIREQG